MVTMPVGLTIRKPQSAGSAKHWTPRKEQLKAVEHLLKRHEAGIFGEPGVGKTSIFLAAIKILLENKLARRVLLVAPLRVCYQVWPAEIHEWIEFNKLTYHILHDKGKTDFALDQDGQIFIMNPDGLPWLMQGDRFKRLGADVLVIDESSKFKGWTTLRMKLLKPKLASFKRRYIGTGSPAPKSYLDLFPQMFCCDRGAALGQYISHFRQAYFFNPDRMGWSWLPQKGAEEAIQKLIKPYILRMENKDLPTVQENVIRVELPEAARKVYDELEEEFITKLKNGEMVTAVSAGTASMKLCQIANGSLYFEKDFTRKVATLHDAKLDALKDLRDELQGQQLLILYEFQHDLFRIAKTLFPKLKLVDVPYIGGGVTPKRSAELEAQWNAGELTDLLGHPAAMGHGLNLQKSGCRHICWYGINWDWELVDQTIRRIRRPGNPHADVFVHYLCCKGTIDEAKIRSLKSKKKSQDRLLDSLLEYAQTRKAV
jgi:SNF2 family DNA or RNA helicase